MRPFFIPALLLLAALPVLAAAAEQSTPAPTFPFSMPAYDSTPTAVDMSFLSPEPAGAHGRVRVQDGHFVDGTGKRIRFLGTNFTFSSSFPPKDAAPKVAARLRKLGINVVRFHHMDNQVAPRGIWLPGQKGLDPEQLDRLDWLIYQLKQNGVYANLNLHVSRNYPGLPADASRAFNYGKVLDNFHQPFIDLQREYARAFLTHVNKYTGKAYCEEPAVAFVEINNENTLLGANWNDLRAMPEPFHGDLTAQWQHWIRARYQNTAALRKAWDATTEAPGEEVLKNGAFAANTEGWSFQRSQSSEAQLQAGAPGPDGKTALSITTTKPGTLAWDFQLMQTGLTLEQNATYTITFQARSEPAQSIGVDTRLDREPWTSCGLSENAPLSPQWRTFSYSFRARNTEPGHGRVTFSLKNQLGRFWIAGVSLRRGGTVGLAPNETIEAGSIPLPPSSATEAQQRDFWAFLAETERAYVRNMVAFLKNDLKVQASIICSQASYGGLGGIYREATLCDYMDMHAYWQHPSFPGRPWDPENWRIGNSSMAADAGGGTLYRLAMHRVAGKPFTVSEYDHPFPSAYCAEMFPMIASFGAFQDWDALYQFDYGDTAADDGSISGFFTLRSHPAKLAFLPIAALMFRGEAVQAGGAPAVLSVPEEQVVPQLLAHGTNVAGVWEAAGLKRDQPLLSPVAVRFAAGNGPVRLAVPTPSPTGAPIRWESTPRERALYTVDAPAVRAVAGFVGGREVRLGDVRLTVTDSPSHWASVALAALDGQPIERSKRLLLVAMGRAENTGMVWNAEHNSVGRAHGQAPTRAEGVALRVSLPGTVKSCRALDGTGLETRSVPVAVEGTGTAVTVGPEYQTVWYLLSR